MTTKQEKNDSPSIEGAVTTRIEKKQVEERIAITAHVVYEAIRGEGNEELHRPAAALAWSALAAGLAMGFSFIADALMVWLLPGRISSSRYYYYSRLSDRPCWVSLALPPCFIWLSRKPFPGELTSRNSSYPHCSGIFLAEYP
jgi:hypothetical protein